MVGLLKLYRGAHWVLGARISLEHTVHASETQLIKHSYHKGTSTSQSMVTLG